MLLSSFPLKLYGIISIASILVAVHISLVMRLPEIPNLLYGSMIIWAVGGFLVWERRKELTWANSLLGYGLGLGIVAIALYINLSRDGYHTFLRFTPFVSAIGLGLLASGHQGLKQYQSELTMLLLTALPPGLVDKLAEWDLLTARSSHFLLHYVGVDVYRNGSLISVGSAMQTVNNTVNVAKSCAGSVTMVQLWVLAIVGIFLVPTKLWQKIIIPVIAMASAYFVNVIRVAILAILVTNKPIFTYWHEGLGGHIFPIAAIVLWGLICKFIILRSPEET
jgi:cyanoexosortase A